MYECDHENFIERVRVEAYLCVKHVRSTAYNIYIFIGLKKCKCNNHLFSIVFWANKKSLTTYCSAE